MPKGILLGTKLPAKNARVTVWQCWVQKYHTFSMFVGIKGGEKDSPAAMIIFKTRDKICNM